ncbi:hypothetical protein AAVH_40859 [Aphelenchoides avenae]|nr:hypothetical protein AAVH_40859 [Aphelenchus avenae]
MKVFAFLLAFLLVVAVAFGGEAPKGSHKLAKRQYLKAGLGGTKEAAVDPSKTDVYQTHGDKEKASSP